ncbi:MAG TPA: hypothetical protein VF247_10970 [Candidatus Krumholzibacteria bacterium]
MSSHRPASGGHDPVYAGRSGGQAGRSQLRLLIAVAAVITAALVVFGTSRARRVAEFAPVTVIDSKEPLQELPVRVAQGDDAVEPAHTYDAMLDLSNVNKLVVGVDLDYVPKGLKRYDAVIRASDGAERFRGHIGEPYFKEGRFMLRLFAKRFPAGDYTLDVEGFDEGAGEGRIIASSWFQVSRE